jgi:tetratricopeptide (TPR) repeat protein
MKRRSSYKLTFFDKHGPGAEHTLRAAGLALMFLVLGSRMLHLSGWSLLGFTLGCGIALSLAAAFVGLRSGSAAGAAAQTVYLGGSTTPYEEQFSQEQALVMQRDYAAALHLYEQRILATPNDPRVLMAAADLHGTHGENPKRAAELYRAVQRLPDVASGNDIYVSNKLADLYLGALKEPGKALVVFRRLIHRYPGSVAEKHARMALANLKPDLVKEADA